MNTWEVQSNDYEKLILRMQILKYQYPQSLLCLKIILIAIIIILLLQLYSILLNFSELLFLFFSDAWRHHMLDL